MATEKQIQEVASNFESTFGDGNGTELGNRLRTEDEATAEEIVDQFLRAEQFPMDANIYNVNVDIIIQSGMSNELWAESYIDAHDITTSEEIQRAKSEDMFYFINDNLDKTKIFVKVNESLREWLEEHGTVEYLAQEMEKAYEPQELEEIIPIEASTEVMEKLRNALSEEGFPSDVDVDEVEYLIANVKLTATYEALAERHIDDIEASGSVQSYIRNQFYTDIINENVFDFDVEITSDPEDFQEA